LLVIWFSNPGCGSFSSVGATRPEHTAVGWEWFNTLPGKFNFNCAVHPWLTNLESFPPDSQRTETQLRFDSFARQNFKLNL
jgi:hypothetical protein